MNILIQFNDCVEMVNKTNSQKHKICEQRNFVNLRGIFNGDNIASNEMLSSDEILFILLSMRNKLFIYFGPLWGNHNVNPLFSMFTIGKSLHVCYKIDYNSPD